MKEGKQNRYETVSRAEYRDILLARMAAGDLYASESLQRIRAIDKALDRLRPKPIYPRGS